VSQQRLRADCRCGRSPTQQSGCVRPPPKEPQATASSTPTPTGEHADVRLLQIVHKTFRLATTRMVDASAKLEPSKLRPAIVQYWEFYAAVLHHHHHTEDTVAFPALVAQRPEFAMLIGTLLDPVRRRS
jgi:Hemerythrin HHE cation binding domain